MKKKMLPEEIREKRIALNLTQNELAGRFKVKPNTIARWERGEITPKAVGMLSLAFQSLEIEKSLESSKVEDLRNDLTEKVKRLRVRHAKNKDEFQKLEK